MQICVVRTTVTSGSFFTNLFALALHIRMQSRTWRCLKKRKKPKTDPRCTPSPGVFDDNQGWIKVWEWVEGLRLYLTLLSVPLPVQTEHGQGCLLSSACFGMHFPTQHENNHIHNIQRDALSTQNPNRNLSVYLLWAKIQLTTKKKNRFRGPVPVSPCHVYILLDRSMPEMCTGKKRKPCQTVYGFRIL